MKEERRKKIITKGDGNNLLAYSQEVWSYRHLMVELAIRDIKVKYAQTFLGVFWSVLQPLTGLLIFVFFFDKVIQIETAIPYPLFAFSGMVCWYYFSFIVGSAGLSLNSAQELIKNIYFPRLILPMAKIMAGFVEFALSIGLLIIFMVIFQYAPGPEIVFLPIVILFNILVGFTIAIWLSALTIQYRDAHHIIPYLIGFGIWLTPVFYPETLIPSAYSWFLYINPVAAVINSFRWCLLGADFPNVLYLVSVAIIVVLFVSGIHYFKRIEDEIPDII